MADGRLVREYLHTLLEQEHEYQLGPAYVNRLIAMGIDNSIRYDLVEQMSGIFGRFEDAAANRIYLSVAVMQMDQFLVRDSVSSIAELHALAGACMLLTSKHVGTRALHAMSLAEFLSIEHQALLAMEQRVLLVLQWRLQMPTPHDFISLYCEGMKPYLPQSTAVMDRLVEVATAISDICCTDLHCCIFGPSIVGLASMYWAATGYSTGEPLLALTKRDRRCLFGLRPLFAKREELLDQALNHIEGILVSADSDPSTQSAPASASGSPDHTPSPATAPQAGKDAAAAAGAAAMDRQRHYGQVPPPNFGNQRQHSGADRHAAAEARFAREAEAAVAAVAAAMTAATTVAAASPRPAVFFAMDEDLGEDDEDDEDESWEEGDSQDDDEDDDVDDGELEGGEGDARLDATPPRFGAPRDRPRGPYEVYLGL